MVIVTAASFPHGLLFYLLCDILVLLSVQVPKYRGRIRQVSAVKKHIHLFCLQRKTDLVFNQLVYTTVSLVKVFGSFTMKWKNERFDPFEKKKQNIDTCQSVLILWRWPRINQCRGNTDNCENTGNRISAVLAVVLCGHFSSLLKIIGPHVSQTTSECVLIPSCVHTCTWSCPLVIPVQSIQSIPIFWVFRCEEQIFGPRPSLTFAIHCLHSNYCSFIKCVSTQETQLW